MTLEFLLTTLVIVASPGTGAIYTVAAGLSGGARASLVAAFGCTLGIVPHMLAAVSGLATLLHTSAFAFQILKYLGVAYLLYMAWVMFRDRGILSLNDETSAKSCRQVIVSAILINLLNPKLSIFFFAFLPQFVRADEASPVNRMRGIESGVHGADLRDLRRLWSLCRCCPAACDLQRYCPDMDAARLCRCFRRPRGAARIHSAMRRRSDA